MKSIIVLGGGMVGSAMAIDLSKNYKVTVCDIDEHNFDEFHNLGITTIRVDLAKTSHISEIVKDYDIVVGAVPGFMGFKTLEAVIKSGKDIIDISFFPEDALLLDKLAKEKGVTAIVDCGVAPGMCNVLLGYHHKEMALDNYLCYVGGLPYERQFPFQYKAPFSPIDVIEEYTRTARYVENGVVKHVEALSDPEYLNFDGIGTLEAFNTDGLRSLIKTVNIPNMKEKTLRYPTHIEYIKVLKGAGFFSDQEIEINGVNIKPIDFTNKLLFNAWKLESGEREFTVMRVILEGLVSGGVSLRHTYDMLDTYDAATNTSSMARTTGYTATAAVNLLADGIYNQHGIIPPEFLGFNAGACEYMLNYLRDRGIIYTLTTEEI